MKRLAYISKIGCIMLMFISMASYAYAQSASDTGLTMLQVLPFITFVLALVTGMLNLYIMNKLGKTREEVLAIVRSEFKTEMQMLESRTASKELVQGIRNELIQMLRNIENKIDISAQRDRYNDEHKH